MYVDNQHIAATPIELLSPFRGLLSPGLADDGALRRLLAGAAQLPHVWHWTMLETRLGAEAAELDLLACVSERDDGRRSLAAALTREAGALGPLHALLAAWGHAEGRLAAAPLIWIEWDRGDLRQPLIWVGVDPGFFAGRTHAPAPAWIPELMGDVEAIGGGAPLSAGMCAALTRCAEALPEDGRILGAASLRPRGRDVLRLFVRLPRSRSGAVDWLTRVGWSGDRKLASWWIRQMTPAFVPAFVQIEVDADVGSYLAIEAPQTVDRFPERWHRESLLRSFIAAGLATENKVDSLLSWPGVARLPADAGEAAHELCRSFHLKLVLDPSGPCEAKAYLGAQRRVARDQSPRAPNPGA